MYRSEPIIHCFAACGKAQKDGTILNGFRFALAIFSGKIILNFGFQKRLRAFLKPIFTDGVVEGNGICSAAFCESAALRSAGLPSQERPCHTEFT